MAFFVHDMEKRRNQLLTLGIICGVDILALVIFGSMGWM
jgi:heme/copper-type cytochrome/quinol oxidase subunit 4